METSHELQTELEGIPVLVEYTADDTDIELISVHFIYDSKEKTRRVKQALKGVDLGDNINIIDLLKEGCTDQLYEDCQTDLYAQAIDAAEYQAEAKRDEQLEKKHTHNPDW